MIIYSKKSATISKEFLKKCYEKITRNSKVQEMRLIGVWNFSPPEKKFTGLSANWEEKINRWATVEVNGLNIF